jgi:hypothetical protein
MPANEISISEIAISQWLTRAVAPVLVILSVFIVVRRFGGGAGRNTNVNWIWGIGFFAYIIFLFESGITPHRYIIHRLSDTLSGGEKALESYRWYFQTNNSYPSGGDVQLLLGGLTQFNSIVGVRQISKCDPYGMGCQKLEITILDERQFHINVRIFDDNMECALDSTKSIWECTSHY